MSQGSELEYFGFGSELAQSKGLLAIPSFMDESLEPSG